MEIIFNKRPYFDLRLWGWLFEIGWFRGNEWKLIEIGIMDFAFWNDLHSFDILRLQILKFSVVLMYDADWEPEEE